MILPRTLQVLAFGLVDGSEDCEGLRVLQTGDCPVGDRLRVVDDFPFEGCGERRLPPCTKIEVDAGTVCGTACCLLLDGS